MLYLLIATMLSSISFALGTLWGSRKIGIECRDIERVGDSAVSRATAGKSSRTGERSMQPNESDVN